ncbi:PilT domain-containing protein [mine drainage metagenome]|uniref:PilT domain-containing protein n=1 Tax=mine drainage metagenome TaxID=410659 RepID=T0Y1Q9_9ZZZZ
MAISSQVLMELYNVITQHISNPVSADNAAAIISDFVDADSWIKLEYSALIAKRAALTASRSKIEIWDALIAETMREYGLVTIVTENVKDFKRVPGVKVINPFK